MKIDIKPYTVAIPFGKTFTATGVTIDVNSYALGVGAGANCVFSDDAGNSYSASISLTKAQFDGWGTSDDYFANCILANAGAERA
jgi:hypothetical protein